MEATFSRPDTAAHIIRALRSRARLRMLVPLILLGYLVYAAISFDLPGVGARMRWDNAKILLGDFIGYKVHVTRDNRSGKLTETLEGDIRDSFPPALRPAWVQVAGDMTRIDLGRGHVVTYDRQGAHYDIPGYGRIAITPDAAGKLTVMSPGPLPDWVSASDSKVTVVTAAGRLNYLKSRVETWRYFVGWESFFFTLDSPFAGRTWGQLAALALWEPRIDPVQSNLSAMAGAVWNNRLWHHGEVFSAMLETVLMAFLGTISAAIIALPLSFLAARNTMSVGAVRFTLRRIFDFIRGTDALIWTLLLVRAFGPGPMTGALAILMTETGVFGKLYSEALENIDEKQVEGIRSTGANSLQRARFGILPQVMPVLLSQVLYALESNTRSATVIGALVGGGIGLLLTQAIQTQKDWEDVAYYLVLIILTVMAMDTLSGWLRRKLIKGE